jgi:hypothetical protein
MVWRGWPYSKAALLIFGLGLVLGLAVVSAELRDLARVASLAMALGIVALPVAIVMDLRRRKPAAKPKTRAPRRRSTPAKRAKPSAKGKSAPRRRRKS